MEYLKSNHAWVVWLTGGMALEIVTLFFPFYFVACCIFLYAHPGSRNYVLMFLISLVLDFLMVNTIGITALAVFCMMVLTSIYSYYVDFQSRSMFVVVLIFGTIFYSILVGYTANLQFAISGFILVLSYVILRLVSGRAKKLWV